MSETFHIGDILSITTGRLVSKDHIGGIYNILNHMTGESLMTHQLPRVSDECAPSLREQFPDLAAIEPPDFGAGDDVAERVFGWLDEMVEQHGATREVEPLPVADHTHINPLDEIAMMRPDLPVVVVEVDPS